MKSILSFILLFPLMLNAQIDLSDIMKGSSFVGELPENIRWTASGEQVCFDRRVNDLTKTICYDLKKERFDTVKSPEMHFFDPLQRGFNKQYQIKDDEIIVYDLLKKKSQVLYSSTEWIFNLQRTNEPKDIYFQRGVDLFAWDLNPNSISLRQITNFTQKNDGKKDSENTHLLRQQKELFDFYSEDKNVNPESLENKGLSEVYIGEGRLRPLQVNPLGSHVVLRLHVAADTKKTAYMSYVTADGQAKSNNARAKVSEMEPHQRMGVYSLVDDSLFWVDFSTLTDIRRKPTYLNDTLNVLYDKDRSLFVHPMVFSKQSSVGIIDVRSADNKDRWLVSFNLTNGELNELVHEHDEAWIGGPGISSWNMAEGFLEWLDDGRVFLFQSERSGYSHLYSYDLVTGSTEALTKGRFEIRNVQRSKDSNFLYVTCNKTHPGNREVYRLDLENGIMESLLVSDGAYELSLSPVEKYLAYRYSSTNLPWEVFLSKNAKNNSVKKLTKSTTSAFDSHDWLAPELTTYPASDGESIYTRVYKPEASKKNNAAVFFVHGAGYLQNAHHFWSSYYREYMFHNLLVEKGYTVFDVDYRGSDGYGRDHRTAIYRHMGGKDLDDYIDLKKYVVLEHGIDEDRIGIYGGSYGGFITLMALLTKPDKFACGAALRSVTDWSHYNHEYTSNILNYPETDPLAYRRSSPIYFAEHLQKPLLMLHGMVDDNVQFQDVVRLSQRFIEEGKKNWELAVFPVEAHGFQKAASWTDEYRRILELFETHLQE